MNRRTFLQAGTLSLGALNLPSLYAKEGNDLGKSVILVWLGGGATHIETWNPIPEAPVEFRSVTGHLDTNVNGIQIGGLFPKLAKQMDKFSIVRSFSHTNSDHDRATHWVMTGQPLTGAGQEQSHPAMGSMVSSIVGASSEKTGLPTYIRNGGITYDKAAFLGGAYNPFDANGDAKKNFMPQTEAQRLHERAVILSNLDKFHKNSEMIKNMNKVRGQAFNIILGSAREAFEIEKEPQLVRDSYGKGLGEKLLLARRLVQYGTRFVTVNHGGWDNHTDILSAMQNLCPDLDNGISTLVQDLHGKGMNKDVLVIVAGEFGRTPKTNKENGRDHFSNVNNILISGGDFEHGRIIGKTDNKATEVTDGLVNPSDLVSVIFKHMSINSKIQKVDNAGRPRYLIENGKSFL